LSELKEILLPDIGDFENVDVVEILVAPGDEISVEDSILVLESDKATMEIPSPLAGTVKELRVGVGDQVSQGALLAILEVRAAPERAASDGDASTAPAVAEAPPAGAAPQRAADGGGVSSAQSVTEAPPAGAAPERAAGGGSASSAQSEPVTSSRPAVAPEPVASEPADPREVELTARPAASHASPAVRRLARELGADLTLVPASGRKGRVLEEDVRGYVKAMLVKGTAAGVPIAGVSVVRAPEIDFEKFGPIELQPLHRIRKLAAANLHRSWVTVPHVTQFDEADITDLESFRQSQKAEAASRGFKLTFLPFVLKACARALQELPHFNASLDTTGESLVLKRYLHIGVAVDTEHGLVVPVIRDVDRKGLFELAAELQEVSEKARDRRLRPEDLQGGSFSISSLGGIGGTFFTPIVNHPEVAILGVSKMEWKPVHREGEFIPRLLLPLSLSYDHRVIDGADAVRFTTRLAQLLADLRLMIL
jgi:pyruvate dehydrogenase E2 component (dihydrolipoamide acetyltransferase)